MILLQILFSLQLAQAGNGNVVGNGGNSVTCPASVATSEIFFRQTAILDLLEGQMSRGYRYRTLASFRGQSLEQAFPKAVRQFLPYSVFEQSQFSQRFARRSQQIRFSSEDLPSLTTYSPAQGMGCTIEQAAIQYGAAQPGADDELVLDISSRIWNSLQTDQKIALLFHEYLLKDRLLMHGSCAVNDIRELTGFILSDEAGKTSESDWQYRTSQDCMKDPMR